MCGGKACTLKDGELDGFLRDHCYNAEAAAYAALLLHGERVAAPPAPVGMEREMPDAHESGKRARSSSEGCSSEPHAPEPHERTEHTASMSAVHLKSVSLAPADQRLLAQLEELRTMIDRLPRQVAREIPAALDTAERERAERSLTGDTTPLARRLAACSKSSDFAEIDGFSYDASENLIQCDDCLRFAYGKDCPNILKHENMGIIVGQCSLRPLSVVRYSVKHHVNGGLHAWCTLRADQDRKQLASGTSAALNVSRLVLHGLKEHDSNRSLERRISTARVPSVPIVLLHATCDTCQCPSGEWHCPGQQESFARPRNASAHVYACGALCASVYSIYRHSARYNPSFGIPSEL